MESVQENCIVIFLLITYIKYGDKMIKRKKNKAENKILNNQEKYKKLRNKARGELSVLEGYFGKDKLNDLTICNEIKKHLEAHQKEINYFGLRGIIIGIVTAIYVYLFNTQITPNIGHFVLDNPIFSYIINQFAVIIVILIFLALYFLATLDFFISDSKRRNQIYINEYMIKLVEEKIDDINGKSTFK